MGCVLPTFLQSHRCRENNKRCPSGLWSWLEQPRSISASQKVFKNFRLGAMRLNAQVLSSNCSEFPTEICWAGGRPPTDSEHPEVCVNYSRFLMSLLIIRDGALAVSATACGENWQTIPRKNVVHERLQTTLPTVLWRRDHCLTFCMLRIAMIGACPSDTPQRKRRSNPSLSLDSTLSCLSIRA